LCAAALAVLQAQALAQTSAQTTAQTATKPATPPAAAAPAASPTPAPVPLKPISDPISTALRETLPARRTNTIVAVESMPAEKFGYKPTPEQISFGHLVVHMIEMNNVLCSKAAGVPSPKVEELKDTDPKEKLVAALKDSFSFCTDTVAKMDDSKLGEVIEGPGGKPYSRGRFALGMATNWADHYAEASMYLRLNGILPPTAKQ
jgi:hypothetical protein